MNHRMKKEKGITLISLVVTIVILLILASITLLSLTGHNKITERATDAQIMTELTQLKEILNKYKTKGEWERVKEGDYSGTLSNNDLEEKGIITKIETSDNISLGMVKNTNEIGLKSKLGKGAQEVDNTYAGKMEELKDVYAIDLEDNDIYYINDGKIWSIEGTGERVNDSVKDLLNENSVKLVITPSAGRNVDKVNISVLVINGAELSEENEYEYYISTSGDKIEGGEWKEYNKDGDEIQVDDGKREGKHYIFVKVVKDKDGNESKKSGKIVEIDGEKYHRIGPYEYTEKEEKATVAIDPNGGTWGGEAGISTITKKYGAKVTIADPIPTKYEIKYESKGGSEVSTKELEKTFVSWIEEGEGKIEGDVYTFGVGDGTLTASYKEVEIVLPETTRLGYTFKGWYEDEEYTSKAGEIGDKYTVKKSITLYGKWEPNIYEIAFDKNYYDSNLISETENPTTYNLWRSTVTNTTVEDENAQKGKVNKIVFGEVTDTRNGVQKGDFEDLTVGNTYTYSVYLKSNKDIRLAIGPQQGGMMVANVTTEWQRFTKTFTATENQYTTFAFYSYEENIFEGGDELYIHSLELMEGTPEHTKENKIYDTELGTLPTPTKEGYTFTGWYTEPTGGTQISSSTMTPAEDTTYYAHWIANPTASITTNPSAVTAVAGNSVSFKVASTGNGTATYQWYYNSSNSTSGGTAISGATSATYSGTASTSPTTLTTMEQGYYYCIVTYKVGSSTKTATSTTALLTVQAANYEIVSSSVTTYYNTLANAVSGAVTGDTITVLNTLTDSSTVSTNKTITINTNGKIVTRTTPITTTGGTLTISGSGTIYCSADNECLLSTGGSIKLSGTPLIKSVGNGIRMEKSTSGNLTIDGGYVYSTLRTPVITKEGYSGTVSISNAYIYSPCIGENAFAANGDFSTKFSATITGSHIGNGATASEHGLDATLPMNTIDWGSSGTLTLSDTSVYAGPYAASAIMSYYACTINLNDDTRLYSCCDNEYDRRHYCVNLSASGCTVNFDSGTYITAGRYVLYAGEYSATLNLAAGAVFKSRYDKYMFYKEGKYIATELTGGGGHTLRYMDDYNSIAPMFREGFYCYEPRENEYGK